MKISKLKLAVILIILSFFIIPSGLRAQKTASIYGVVTEQETGEPLVGVNILIKGTYYGVATDEQGRFRIDGISPGVYSIRVTMMGYKTKLFTGIKLEAGEEKNLDVSMPRTTLAAGQEIVVVGKKEVVDVENT